MSNITFDYKNKTAIITGGVNGIGRCVAKAFMNAGAKVAVIDKADTPIACGLYFRGDIADEQTLIDFVVEIKNKFGGVDYLINNACLSRGGILSDCGYDDFMYVQKVGVVAPYMLTKLLLPYFKPNASIVNIASTRAFQSQPDTESYSAAKGGIVALTHAMAVSLAGRVRVNCISPGWIDTGENSEHSEQDKRQHPVRRIGTPSDIAEMVLYLCSDSARFITGENITIDGGMSKLMIYHNDNGWNLEK